MINHKSESSELAQKEYKTRQLSEQGNPMWIVQEI